MSETRTAVVIGASMAGLLAARVLADHYDEVVVIDRDRLPDEPVARAGVPQGRHVHGLLARGREAMEELFPGLTDDLAARGAPALDFHERARLYVGDRPLAPGRSGLLSVAVSRPLLEWLVRQRVSALPNVEIRDRTAVLDLAMVDAGGSPRVTGVAVSALDWPGTVVTLDADLVVDASGRTSRTGEWLERRGLEPPEEEHVRVDVCYATRRFRRRETDADGILAVIATADPHTSRSAVVLAQEDDRWAVGLTGVSGDRPPTDLEGFLAFADDLQGPVGTLLRSLEPLDADGKAATHRFPSDVRRRYEQARDLPDGLLVLGDALCAFNPAYGQGMTVAALEALELRDCLAAGGSDLARRFFRGAARHVDTPWTLVVGQDRQRAGSDEPVPVATRIVNRYVARLMRAATDDVTLARTFLQVNHLVAPPSRLFRPKTLARVALSRRWDSNTAGLPLMHRVDVPASAPAAWR